MVIIHAQNLYDKAKRIAKCSGVTIFNNRHGKFAIEEALENDDEKWFNQDNFTPDEYHEFITMCLTYGKDIDASEVNIELVVQCPECGPHYVPVEYVHTNIVSHGRPYVICSRCGEILLLAANINMTISKFVEAKNANR